MRKYYLLLISACLFLVTCKRETVDNSLPGGLAEFSLVGNPGCTGSIPSGNYALWVVLDSSNSVPVQVNVTKQGSYNISAYHQGMTFRRAGYFNNTGLNTVILIGSGLPTTSGINVVPLTIGNTNCSFQVNVSALASYTIDCPSVTISGNYYSMMSLNNSHKIVFSANVITPGLVDISMGPINGIRFTSGLLVFSTPGIKQIVLNGTGEPLNNGNFSFTLPGQCNFIINVTPIPINWSFYEGTTFYSGTFYSGELLPDAPSTNYTTYNYKGFYANWYLHLFMGIGDIGGGIQNNEIYNTVSSFSNSTYFQIEDWEGNILYTASPTIPGLTFQLIVTNHNTQTRTITGTFSGTVKDGGGTTRTITNGVFNGTYP